MQISHRYALSTFGKTIPFAAADAFCLYFYTDVAGIAPARAGAMVLALLCWSALCDPLAGWIYQKLVPRLTGPRFYFACGTAAATFFFILGFTKLPSTGWQFLAGASMAFRFAYALIDVPHNALLSRLQLHGRSPVGLGALRLGATIAGTLASIAAARYALDAGGASAVSRFFIFACATGAAGALLFIAFFPFGAISRPTAAHPAVAGEPPSPAAARAYFITAAFFASAVAATIINGMFSKDIVYIAKYVLHDPAWTVTEMALFTIGKVAGIPCWIGLSKKVNAVQTMQTSFLLIAMTGVGVAIAPPHFSYLGTGLFFFGAGIAGTNITGWALMPDCARQFRPGSEPLIFGAFTAANKIASGLSGAIIGYTLMWLGIGNNPISMERQARSLYWLVYIYPIAGAAIGIASIGLFVLLSPASQPRLPPLVEVK